MANFVTTQTSVVSLAGFEPALLFIAGTYTSSAGATGGELAAGYSLTGGTYTAYTDSSIGGRKVVAAWLQPTTEDVTTPKTATAYNSTLDRDGVTVTSVANGTGNYYLLCIDNGN